jgi:anhydro-N-acetylmuramic acid kinase
MSSYNLIGLMSGTSMDGLDIVNVQFNLSESNEWSFNLNHSLTVVYSKNLLNKLNISKQLSTVELLLLDKELGLFFSTAVNNFIQEYQLNRGYIDAICSHGHTIFHQPENGFTHQIGCGETIAFHTGIKVVNDFRQKDIVAGGQGAPLVPIGDKLLFKNQADAFLNIGGFANVCYPSDNTKAYDICPGNLPLNHFAKKQGQDFDFNGEIARAGNLNQALLDDLNTLPFYSQEGPKSLGTEWLENKFMPHLENSLSNNDIMNTLVEHICIQIAADLDKMKTNSLFITGGGAKNAYLIERLKTYFHGKVIIPEDTIIDFKEALIFGFLGALYLNNQPNSLSSVTGAKKDTIGGVLHLPS